MEEIKKPAEENFPQKFRDGQAIRNLETIRDENDNIVYDENGNKVTRLSKTRFSKALKNWATKFANFGVAIDDIDFDDYLLQGYTIERCPNKCLTVIQHPDGWFIKDKRTLGGLGDWWEAGNRRLFRKRDNRYVDISKVPDSQLLEEAKAIWVIPQEVLITDVREIRSKRRENSDDPYKRYAPENDPSKRWFYNDSGSHLDKSGYLVDTIKLKERLSAFKLKKASEEGGIQEACKKEIVKLAEAGNSLIARGMKAINWLIDNNQLEGNEGNLISAIKEFKTSLGRMSERFENLCRNNSRFENFKNFYNLISENYEFGILKNRVETLEVKAGVNNGAYEMKSTAGSLQAMESYYVPKDLMAALEEV